MLSLSREIMPHLTFKFNFFQPLTNNTIAPNPEFITTLTNVLTELLPSLAFDKQQTLVKLVIDYLQPWSVYNTEIQQLQAKLEENSQGNIIPKINRDLFRKHFKDIKQWITEHVLDNDSKDYLDALNKLADHPRYANSTPVLFKYDDVETIDAIQAVTKNI